jgi:hypothetical protein
MYSFPASRCKIAAHDGACRDSARIFETVVAVGGIESRNHDPALIKESTAMKCMARCTRAMLFALLAVFG